MTPHSSFLSNILHFLKTLLPWIVLVLAVLLSLVFVPLPHFGQVRPDLLLILAYFWAIYRPDFYPVSLIFLSGLIVDLVTGSIIGLTPILLIIVYLTVRAQRRFLMAQSFFIQWVCFLLVGFGVALLRWTGESLLHFSFMPMKLLLLEIVFSVCLFPILVLGLIRIHKMMD